MKLQLLRADELTAEHLAKWSEYRAGNEDLRSPYFHPEFTRTVGSVRKDVFVAVLDEGSAFFPHQRGTWGVGKAVGGPISDYHGVIARLGFRWDPLELVRGCGLSVWDFDHLLASQTDFEKWHTVSTSSPVIDLSAHVAVGSAKLRADAMRRRRKLEREVGPLRFEMHTLDEAVFGALRKWKSAQYHASGGLDLFEVPWVREVLERIWRREGNELSGMLSVLWTGERPIAAHFGLRSGDVLHYWFPAYDPELGSYSPGILLLLAIIDAAPAHGISMVDLGKGDALYKQRLANGSVPLAEGSVVAGRLIHAARRSRTQVEQWVRNGPLIGPARRFGKFIRRFESARRFR
ncbi:MAG: hypothetical protein JWQ44_1163 [Chthoniobacter sp.]|nr:hypothetical protein [Chthoniobacter sp.]